MRTLLTHGARALVRIARSRQNNGWLDRLLRRRPVNVVVSAQANKTARIVWAVLTKAEDCRRPAVAAG